MVESVRLVEEAIKTTEKKKRIDIIDAARGFSVLLMVIHHAFYDIYAFLDGPEWIYRNPYFMFLQIIFIGIFIFVSGIASRFSRGNIERGAIVMVFAIIITYVTVRMESPIYFGILHLLGSFMIFYGLTRKLWDNIPRVAAPCIYISLIILSVLARECWSPVSDNPVIRDLLSVFGWRQERWVNADYQSVLPWIFVFLLGTWVGEYIREGKFPKWFYKTNIPFLPLVGRNALAIYMLHQPVLYGLTMLVLYLRT